MARRLILAAALVAALLPVSGAGGADAQTPKRGGTLSSVVALEPSCLNPFGAACTNIGMLNGVLQGAFKRAPDYSWRPGLVARVDVTRTPPFTLTYHIHPEARWNDGVPVSARDFTFTHAVNLAYPDQAELHKSWVRSVRALGPKTFRVVLRSRFGHWQNLFSVVLPEHALRGEKIDEIWSDRIDNPKTGALIASGPFLVRSWERGEQLTLARNPRYWGPHPAYLDAIVFRFSLDPAVVGEHFKSGRADIGQWQFDPALVPVLRRVSGVSLRFARDSPGWEHLAIRVGPGGHPALESKLARRALAYSIDRVAIVRAVAGVDVDANPRPRDNLLLRRGSRTYRPNWSVYRYRPREARRLLERAGCRPGPDGIYSCAGERMTLRVVSRGTLQRRVQTLELAQVQARRAGIELVPVYVSSNSHNQVLESGDFDVSLFAWFGPGADGPGMDDIFGCGGPGNAYGYCQRLITRDLVQADRIVDPARRARLLNAIDTRLAGDVPAIPLFEILGLAAVTSKVRNFLPSFSVVNTAWNAENWWLDD